MCPFSNYEKCSPIKIHTGEPNIFPTVVRMVQPDLYPHNQTIYIAILKTERRIRDNTALCSFFPHIPCIDEDNAKYIMCSYLFHQKQHLSLDGISFYTRQLMNCLKMFFKISLPFTLQQSWISANISAFLIACGNQISRNKLRDIKIEAQQSSNVQPNHLTRCSRK